MISHFKIIPYTFYFRSPFLFSGQSIEKKEGYFVYLFSGDEMGVGDCAVFPELGTETQEQALEKLNKWLKRLIPFAIPQDFDGLVNLFPWFSKSPASRFALEQALVQLMLKKGYFKPEKAPFPLRSNAIIGQMPLTQRLEKAKLLIDSGFNTLKCKISPETLSEDLKFIKEIKQISDTPLSLRLDANGSFSYNAAYELCESLDPDLIEYIEDPVFRREDIINLSIRTNMPIAVDRLIKSIGDCIWYLSYTRIENFVVKPLILGGYHQLWKSRRAFKDKEIKLVISSSFEHPLGLEYIKFATAELGISGTHGLAVMNLYKSDYGIENHVKQEVSKESYLENCERILSTDYAD